MANYYVLDEFNNRVEAFDKEGVLAAIEEAIRNGSLEGLVADAAFISKLKCCVTGATNKIGFITQAKYNELKANSLLDNNTYYFIYDDTTAEGIEAQLNELTAKVEGLTETLKLIKDGDEAVPQAIRADMALSADYAAEAGDATNAKYLVGETLNPTTNSLYGSIVPITKTGLYVCTIKKTYTLGSTTKISYLTALISIPNLTTNCSSNIATGNSASAYENRLVIYYSETGKYLQLYDNVDDATYKYEFYNCRLITEY